MIAPLELPQVVADAINSRTGLLESIIEKEVSTLHPFPSLTVNEYAPEASVEISCVEAEFDHIYEFYCNSEAGVNKAIKARLDEMNKEGSIPDLEAECQSCATKFGVPLVFDYSNFFVLGS